MKKQIEIFVEFCVNGSIIENPELQQKSVLEGEMGRVYEKIANLIRSYCETEVCLNDKIKFTITAETI